MGTRSLRCHRRDSTVRPIIFDAPQAVANAPSRAENQQKSPIKSFTKSRTRPVIASDCRNGSSKPARERSPITRFSRLCHSRLSAGDTTHRQGADDKFASHRGVLRADTTALIDNKGMGEAGAVMFRAVADAAERLAGEEVMN